MTHNIEQQSKVLENKRADRETAILNSFSPEERKVIIQNLRNIQALGTFVGGDGKLVVKLNSPGGGWHFDPSNNIIRVDPKDLIELSRKECEFIMAHEGAHRRITLNIPEQYKPTEEGYANRYHFIFNCNEDGRINNFAADTYLLIDEGMELAYASQYDDEKSFFESQKQRKKYKQLGFLYLYTWYRERYRLSVNIPEDTDKDVLEVYKSTIDAARRMWWIYPTPEESRNPERIKDYQMAFFKILYEEIWPEYKKLCDLDSKDEEEKQAKKEAEKKKKKEQEKEQGKDKQKSEDGEENQDGKGGDSDEGESSSDSDDTKKGEERKSKDKTDSSSEERDASDSLTEEELDNIQKKVKEMLEKEAEEAEDEKPGVKIKEPGESEKDQDRNDVIEEAEEKAAEGEGGSKTITDAEFKKQLQRELEQMKSESPEALRYYIKRREALMPQIRELVNKLREIFTERRTSNFERGYSSGKRINLGKRIQERVTGIPVVYSKAWERRLAPSEKDYAITLLVDLSSSMGNKIIETIDALIIITEALNKLGIKLEIIGFNRLLFEYKNFNENLSSKNREKFYESFEEVTNFDRAGFNDDGWALASAHERLKARRESQKIMIVLSDGIPWPSLEHSGPEFDLKRIVGRIISGGELASLIGLGIGEETEHVRDYYPSSRAEIKVDELPKELAEVLIEAIDR